MTKKIYEIAWGKNGIISMTPVDDARKVSEALYSNAINFSAAIPILDVGLNVLNVVLSAKLLVKVNKIDEKVDKINAKFDLLFLDKSIDYFLQNKGLNQMPSQEALNILENDLFNALCAVESTKDLRIPAFLAHKILVLAEGISQINQTIYMILHNGSVPRLSEKELEDWVKEKGSGIDLLPSGGFASQEDILEVVDRILSDKETPFLEKFKIGFKSRDGVLGRVLGNLEQFQVAHPLVLLLREMKLVKSFRERLAIEVKAKGGKIMLINVA